MRSFIKSLELRLSDLFLLLGFIPFAFFSIFTNIFSEHSNPDEIDFKLWMMIPCFIITLGCWSYYIYLENKQGNLPKRCISIIFISLAIFGLISILIQPNTFSISMEVKGVNSINKAIYGDTLQIGDIVNAPLVPMELSGIHYTFFSLDYLLILLFIYIGLFIFPKRFKSIIFLKYLGYILFFFAFALILYSYIFEFDKYINFFKYLFSSGEEGKLSFHYRINSFIIHPNAYGMFMLISIIFALINHAITKRRFYYIFVGIFFINMLFSYSRTSILISLLLITIHLVYRLVSTYKEYSKRNLYTSIGIGSLVLLGIVFTIISYASSGTIFSAIYNFTNGFLNQGSMISRFHIWQNIFQLLNQSPLYYFFGRGFGLSNEMLYQMNVADGDPVSPAHNSFLAVLLHGGIPLLLVYLAFLAYSTYIIIKCFKKNPDLTLSISFGVLAFFLYSFNEEIQYLIYTMMLPVMILYHVLYLDNPDKETEQTIENQVITLE